MSCQQMSRFLPASCTASELAVKSITTPEDPYVFTDTVPAEPPTLFIPQKSRIRFVDIQLEEATTPAEAAEPATTIAVAPTPCPAYNNAKSRATSKKSPLALVNGNATNGGNHTPAAAAAAPASKPVPAAARAPASSLANGHGRNTPTVTPFKHHDHHQPQQQHVTQSQPKPGQRRSRQQPKRQAAVDSTWNGHVVAAADDDDCYDDDEACHSYDDGSVAAPHSTGSLSSEEDDGGCLMRSSSQHATCLLQHTPSLWQTPLLLDTSSAVVSPPTSPASLPSPTGSVQMAPLSPCPPPHPAAHQPPATPPLLTLGTLPPSKFHNTTIAQHLQKVQCIKKSPKKPMAGGRGTPHEVVVAPTPAMAVTRDPIEIGSVVSLGGDDVDGSGGGLRAVALLPTPSPPPLLPQLEPFHNLTAPPQPPQQQQQHSVSDLNEIPVNVIFRKPQTSNEITRQILEASDDGDGTAAATPPSSAQCPQLVGVGENVHLQKINSDGSGSGDMQMATIPPGGNASKLKHIKIIAPSIRAAAVAPPEKVSATKPPKLQPLTRVAAVPRLKPTTAATLPLPVAMPVEVEASAAAAATSTEACLFAKPSHNVPLSSVSTMRRGKIAPTASNGFSLPPPQQQQQHLINTPAFINTPPPQPKAAAKPVRAAKPKQPPVLLAGKRAVPVSGKGKGKRKGSEMVPYNNNNNTINNNNNNHNNNNNNTITTTDSCSCDAAGKTTNKNNNNNNVKHVPASVKSLGRSPLVTFLSSPLLDSDSPGGGATENNLPHYVQQQHWLSPSYPQPLMPLRPSNKHNHNNNHTGNNNNNGYNREERITAYKNMLRRQALQLLATHSLQKLPVQNARLRLMCVDRLLQKYENHNRRQLTAAKKCNVPACMSDALLLASYCQRHIGRNETQQHLLMPCSWKLADNTECRVPVFDVTHVLPLCQQHARDYERLQKEKVTVAVATTSIAQRHVVMYQQNGNNNNNNNNICYNNMNGINNKSPYPVYVPRQLANGFGNATTTTAAANIVAVASTSKRKRKSNATGNPVGRPTKRGRKPLQGSIAAVTPAIAPPRGKGARAQKPPQPTPLFTGVSLGQQQQQQHQNKSSLEALPQHMANGGNMFAEAPPALAPLSGLDHIFDTDNSCANTLSHMAGDLKEQEIQQIVTQFAMSSNFAQNMNYNNNNNNNNNNNFNFNMNHQHEYHHEQQPHHQTTTENNQHSNNNNSHINGTTTTATPTANGLASPNSLSGGAAAFMSTNTNSNSNFTSVFSSSSSLPSTDDFLSQDMLSICDNSSAYASSEDTGFGGLSENDLQAGCGGGGVASGGDEGMPGDDGANDADDINLLEEQDLANMFNALPVDSLMNELFNTVRPDEREEVERALEVVDSHLKSLQQKMDTADFLGDFLDVSDQILADADLMRSPGGVDCIDTSGLFADVVGASGAAQAGPAANGNGMPSAADIRGLLQT